MSSGALALPVQSRRFGMRATLTSPLLEVATRSLARAAPSTPLPVFLPRGRKELEAWLALPRDRQALLTAIAARLDAEAQRNLQLLLGRGVMVAQDQLGEGDLMLHLVRLYSGPNGCAIDPASLVESTLRSLALGPTEPAHVMTILLANRLPAEFVRLMAGLAGPAGQVALPGGRTLTRALAWRSLPGDPVARLLGGALGAFS